MLHRDLVLKGALTNRGPVLDLLPVDALHKGVVPDLCIDGSVFLSVDPGAAPLAWLVPQHLVHKVFQIGVDLDVLWPEILAADDPLRQFVVYLLSVPAL